MTVITHEQADFFRQAYWNNTGDDGDDPVVLAFEAFYERFPAAARPGNVSVPGKVVADVLFAEAEFRSQMPADWLRDPLAEAVDALRAATGESLVAPAPQAEERLSAATLFPLLRIGHRITLRMRKDVSDKSDHALTDLLLKGILVFRQTGAGDLFFHKLYQRSHCLSEGRLIPRASAQLSANNDFQGAKAGFKVPFVSQLARLLFVTTGSMREVGHLIRIVDPRMFRFVLATHRSRHLPARRVLAAQESQFEQRVGNAI